MMVGLPIVGLATTELVTVIENGISGYVATDLDQLKAHMRELIENPAKAHYLGANAREQARSRFSIQRFVHDWNRAFERVVSEAQGSGSTDQGSEEKEAQGTGYRVGNSLLDSPLPTPYSPLLSPKLNIQH